MKMNPEAKRLWIEDLRTTDAGQTTGALRRDRPGGKGEPVGFCCLGRLCEVAITAGVKVAVDVHHEDVTYDGDCLFLPESVARWAGLLDEDGGWYSSVDLGARSASSWNDSEKKTFAEIADLVEEHL